MTHLELCPPPYSRRNLAVVAAIALALLALAGPTSAQPAPAPAGPTLDEVLQKHYEARGGLAALQALDRIVVQGGFSMQGFELPFVEYRQRPNRLRTEVDVQGSKIVEAYDGKTAWRIDPMTGSGKPEKQGEAETKALAARADVDGTLVDWRRKGHKVELAGKEQVGGADAYKLLVTTKDGLEVTTWLDATTYLEKQSQMSSMMQGQPMEMTFVVKEYADVGGAKIPSKVTIETAMGAFDLSYSSFAPGSTIDENLFFMPGQVANPALTLAEVLDRHTKARAKPGAEYVKTIRAAGKLGLMGLQLPLQMTFARPRLARLDADMAGTKLTLAFDGTIAWTVSPMQGITVPEAMPPEAAEAIALFSDFLWGLLAEREAQGLQVELAGIEKVERDETYKLSMKRADGQTREVYLGGEDFLERKVHLQAVFMGVAQQLDALLADYRSVDGIALPHSIQILAGGNPAASVVVDSVETNVEVESGFFSLPAAPATTPPGGAQ